MGHRPPDPSLDPFWHLINHGILDMEPPDHTRVRRLVAKAFTPRMVESMREPVQRLTDGLVDEVDGSGEFDLLPAIAEPLPVAVIAELLGVPEEDRHLLASVVRGHLPHVRTASHEREIRRSPCGRASSSPSTCGTSRGSAGRRRRGT